MNFRFKKWFKKISSLPPRGSRDLQAVMRKKHIFKNGLTAFCRLLFYSFLTIANLQLFYLFHFNSCWWSTAVVAACLSTFAERDLSMLHISSTTQRKFWMHWLTYTTKMWCIRICGSVVLVMGKTWHVELERTGLKWYLINDLVKLLWLKKKLKNTFEHIYMNNEYYLLSERQILIFRIM